jgi:trehalose 6-phosphate phosphatase
VGDFSEAISRLRDDPAHWLIAFDFDGTLSPIVARPEDARLDPRLAPTLGQLREAVGWLAVISGRPRDFLLREAPGLLAIGSYGLELPEELSYSGLPERFDAAVARGRLEAAAGELEGRLPAGARLERKPFGLAVHYRGAGTGLDAAALTREVAEVASRRQLELLSGRMVLELKPHEAVDKGWALGLLAARLEARAVVFCGDDMGDLPAWQATRQLGTRIPTLAVGIASAELPRSALDECDLVLSDRSQLSPFLSALLTAASATRPGPS